MGFFDALFGRTRPTPGKADQLFQLTTARLDIETTLFSTFGRRAALVLRSVDNAAYDAVSRDLSDVLKIGGQDLPVKAKSQMDSMGFHWTILEGDELDDIVNALHLTAELVREAGYSDSLLAAMFVFDHSDQERRLDYRWYLIYSYRRGLFYPFVPKGGRNRDFPHEFRLAESLKNWLQVEKDTERWYALWDPPI